jgi:hypothetical protein
MPRRRPPSDPQAIAARKAEQLAADRTAARNPANWGVDPEVKKLSTGRAVRVVRGHRAKIIHARRLDAFDSLHERGRLTDAQHQAAQRLIKDWAEMLGIGGAPANDNMGGPIDASGSAELVTQRMIDAGARIFGGRELAGILQVVGPVSAKVLVALVEPIVLEGIVTYWRGQVQKVTGEAEVHAQGAIVRMACEDLRLAYGLGEPQDLGRAGRIHPFHPVPTARAS